MSELMSSSARSAAFFMQALQAVGLLVLAVLVGKAVGLPAGQLAAFAMSDSQAALISIVLVLLVAATLMTALNLARRRRPVRVPFFLAWTTAATILLKAVLIATVDPTWSGDFLRYWDNAIAMVENGAVDVGTSIYKQRASLVFYPIYKTFGDSHLALKIINAGAFLTTLLIVYDMLRIACSHQAAQCFTLLFLLCPMPAFDALFPSHDFWGAVFLVFSLWFATRACYMRSGTLPSRLRVIAYAILSASCIVLLEIQRGAASMLPVSMGIAVVLLAFGRSRHDNGDGNGDLAWRFSRKSFFVVFVAATILFVPLSLTAEKMGFKKSTQVDSARATTLMKMSAHGGVFGNARSATWVRFDQRFQEKRKQGATAVADFGTSIVLTSWADPEGSKLRLISDVSPRLFQLGYPADWNVALKSPVGMPTQVRNTLVAYTDAFGLLFSVVATLALIVTAASGRSPPMPVLLGLIFTLLLAASLLLFFENKPPNLYSGWIALLMLISWLGTAISTKQEAIRRIGVATSLLGVAFITALYFISTNALDLLYDDEDGRVINGWTVQQHPIDGSRERDFIPSPEPLAFNTKYYPKGSIKDWIREDAGDDSRRLAKYATDFFTIMELAPPIDVGDRVTMSKRICVRSSRTSLELFLFSGYQRKDRPRSFVFEIAADGEVQKRLAIPTRGSNFRLVLANDLFRAPGCQVVSLSLVSNVASDRKSWQRASHVEIWNPRMIDATLLRSKPPPTR